MGSVDDRDHEVETERVEPPTSVVVETEVKTPTRTADDRHGSTGRG